jgi:hypothetical protein
MITEEVWCILHLSLSFWFILGMNLYIYVLIMDYFLLIIVLLNGRGENGELRVGVRRLMRQVNSMPSSVISSHSMHLGVLATASHAISTGTLFSVFYKPRFDVVLLYLYICLQCTSY